MLIIRKTPNKAILDFQAAGKAKCDLPLPHKIKRLARSILAVDPGTAGSADLIIASIEVEDNPSMTFSDSKSENAVSRYPTFSMK